MFTSLLTPFGRWVLAASFFAFINAYYGLMLHGFDTLFVVKHSEIVFSLVLLIYGTIIYLGIQAWKATFRNEIPRISVGYFIANQCMGVALIGTIIGMMSAFGIFETSTTAALKDMIRTIGLDVSTALTTTFVGISGAISIHTFMAITFKSFSHKED